MSRNAMPLLQPGNDRPLIQSVMVLMVPIAGCVDFWWYHALISDEMHDGLHKACNMSEVGPLYNSSKRRGGVLSFFPATFSCERLHSRCARATMA